MFTGIVRALEKVTKIDNAENGLSMSIKKPTDWNVGIGDSIAINGLCGTVVAVDSELSFEFMPESLERSNLLDLKVGDRVNLEQSLQVSDRLDGHMVQGHVDTTTEIVSIENEGNSKVFTLNLEELDLIAPKGAICLDGISLTVVDVEKEHFSVKIIPHTVEHTNLENREVGERLNVEFDILAKYLKQLHANR